MLPRLGERLVEAGLLTQKGLEQALEHQRLHGLRLGECVLELQLVPEKEILTHLAALLRTRYVVAEKLATAQIPEEALQKVPVRLAERQSVLPVNYSPPTKTLTVVMTAPQDEELIREILYVAQVNQVTAVLGMKKAIHAAIRKNYYGDRSLMDALLRGEKHLALDELAERGDAEIEPEGSFDATVVKSRTDLSAAPDTAPGQRPSSGTSPDAIRAAIAAAVKDLSETELSDVHQVASRIYAAMMASNPASDPSLKAAESYRLARAFSEQRKKQP